MRAAAGDPGGGWIPVEQYADCRLLTSHRSGGVENKYGSNVISITGGCIMSECIHAASFHYIDLYPRLGECVPEESTEVKNGKNVKCAF